MTAACHIPQRYSHCIKMIGGRVVGEIKQGENNNKKRGGAKGGGRGVE